MRAEIQLESQRFLFIQVAGVVAGDIVAVVAAGIDERAIGVGALVGDESVGISSLRAVGDKARNAPKEPPCSLR